MDISQERFEELYLFFLKNYRELQSHLTKDEFDVFSWWLMLGKPTEVTFKSLQLDYSDAEAKTYLAAFPEAMRKIEERFKLAAV